MFTLNKSDFVNGLVMAFTSAVFVALTAVLGAVIMAPNFDVFTVEWVRVGRSLVNAEIIAVYGAVTGYLMKNLFTNNQGSFMGVTPETK